MKLTHCFWKVILLLTLLSNAPWTSRCLAMGNFPPFDIPAMLLASNPMNGAQNVPLNSPVSFTFSTAMAPTYNITWSGNVTPGNFNYTWSADRMTLTAQYNTDLPADASITWNLVPDSSSAPGFKNANGTPLMTVIPVNGSFHTMAGSSSTNNPGDDPTQPHLLYATPDDGTTQVLPNSPIIFKFSTAMAPSYGITWSGNVVPANFNYTWSADHKTLTAAYNTALPSGSVISWKLIPSNGSTAGFSGANGTPLLTTGFRSNGSFRTELPSQTSCQPTNNTGQTGYGIYKNIYYVQTGANPPVINNSDDNFGASFFAMFKSTAQVSASSVTLSLPDGRNEALINFYGGLFGLPDTTPFESVEALEARYPGGAYRMSAVLAQGQTAAATLNVPANAVMPTPQIQNLAQLQSANPNAVVIQWNPFTGAASMDHISLQIMEGNTVLFFAPNPCVPIELAPTATSISVPPYLLLPNQVYEASLTFAKFGAMDTTSIPGMTGFSGFSKETRFQIKTGNGGEAPSIPDAPRFKVCKRLPDGALQLQLAGQDGATFVVESSTDLVRWTQVQSVTLSNGVADIPNQRVDGRQTYYRAVHRP